MIRSYDDYINYKIEKIEELGKIGKRFVVSYSDFFPSEVQQCAVARKVYDNFNEKTFLREIKDYKTIIEYIGNGVYRDLLTGYHVLSDTTDDIDDCIISPFYCFNIPSHEDDSNIDDFHYNYDDKDYIIQIMDKKAEEIVGSLYDSLLQKPNISESEKEKIKEEYELFDQRLVGRKYAIQYDDLEPVIDYSLACNKLHEAYLFSDLWDYTIVEYLGHHRYRDLTTNMIYLDYSIDLQFKREGERVNYTEINQEEFDTALEYPIKVPKAARKIITDSILLSIWDRTLQSKTLQKRMENVYSELQSSYQYYKKEKIQKESQRQYTEARKEYDEFLAEQERQSKIDEVKKVYQLKM